MIVFRSLMSTMRFATLALLTLLLAGRDAFAWGPDGHRIVCEIAYQQLDSRLRNEIGRLSRAYRTPDGRTFRFFTDGCVFPDEARAKARDNMFGWDHFDPFDRWHFVNVPRAARHVRASDCQNDCVLTGIDRHATALATARNDQDRAEALFFLGHWVADVHQPLHVSYSDDHGGNDVAPIRGGFYTSEDLHAVWDSGIVATAASRDGGWRSYAGHLAARITAAERTAWISTPPLAWADESYALTTLAPLEYCEWKNAGGEDVCAPIPRVRTLGQQYQREFQSRVETRLQQAGVRLADLIRQRLTVR